MRGGRELVARASAAKAELVDEVKLLTVQEVHDEAARLEHHVVCKIEFVDVHGHARDGRDD